MGVDKERERKTEIYFARIKPKGNAQSISSTRLLQHNASARRITAKIDASAKRGSGSVNVFSTEGTSPSQTETSRTTLAPVTERFYPADKGGVTSVAAFFFVGSAGRNCRCFLGSPREEQKRI
jgi:hypothetical protein